MVVTDGQFHGSAIAVEIHAIDSEHGSGNRKVQKLSHFSRCGHHCNALLSVLNRGIKEAIQQSYQCHRGRLIRAG